MRNLWILALNGALLGAHALYGQATPAFTFRATVADTAQTLPSGGLLAMPAAGVGATSTASITLNLVNAVPESRIELTSFSLDGSTDFASPGPAEGTVLSQSVPSVRFTVIYTARTGRTQNAAAIINYRYPGGAGVVSLSLTGTAPDMVITATPENGNAEVLPSGGTITFPPTELATSFSTAVTVTNRGTSPGFFDGASINGSPQFRLTGVPSPPVPIDPGRSLQFNIVFTPTARAAVSATLQVLHGSGALRFAVTGSGKGPEFSYQIVQGAEATPLVPGGTISMADTPVRGSTLTLIRLTNSGNGNGVLQFAQTTGEAFSLADGPPLPFTVKPAETVLFAVKFAPTAFGPASGKLRIGSDLFDLAGVGVGSSLTFSYTSAPNISIPLTPGNTVVFPTVAVGQSSSVRLSIRNEGNARAAIAVLAVSSTPVGIFASPQLPPLPLLLEPGQQAEVPLVFTPKLPGAFSASLQADTLSFTLAGSAEPPPVLPAYRFQGPTGTVDPATQFTVGLSLAARYPLDLMGTLRLTFASDVLTDDPALQFATGGRTVAFTIPANTTEAVFPNRTTQLLLQTGTVAGRASITPSFATSSGIDLTPGTPLSLDWQMGRQAPVISSVTVASVSANTLNLTITGYATGRTLDQMNFQFNAKPGENLTTPRVSLDVSAGFRTWYQSAASTVFGSQFSAAVPFTFQGSRVNPATAIQSVTVTLTNAQGVSAPQTVTLP